MWAMQHYRARRTRSFLSISGSDLSDPMAVKQVGEEAIYPNFLKIAEGYGVASERVTRRGDLAAAFQRMLANADEP